MCIWNSNVFSWQKCHADKRLRKSGCQRSANTEFPKFCTLSERLEQNKGLIPSSYLTIHSSGNLISIFSWRCTTQQPQLLKMARTNDKEGNQFLSWGWKIDAIPYFNWRILKNAPLWQTQIMFIPLEWSGVPLFANLYQPAFAYWSFDPLPNRGTSIRRGSDVIHGGCGWWFRSV